MPGRKLSFETANPPAGPKLGNAIKRLSPTAVLRATLATVIVLSSPAWASEGEAQRALAAFAKSARIDFWPALKLCGYAEAFGDRRAGLWLKVIDRESAQARWDGACHVPANHRISAWPAELPPGEYIVAVTADTPRNEGFPKGNRHLRIEAVLAPTVVDPKQLFAALIDRVCAGQDGPPAEMACRERPATTSGSR